MKIIGWTSWGNPKYTKTSDLGGGLSWAQICEKEAIIVSEIVRNGYKFDGEYHQNGEFGVPVFDDGTVYEVSKRVWGDIIARAYPKEINNSDGMGYCIGAWVAPEAMVVPGGMYDRS